MERSAIRDRRIHLRESPRISLRSIRATMSARASVGRNQKAGARPAVLLLKAPGARAERGSTRALEAYFFFDFLAFFAFFAFFAFLAIVSSQSLMDGNATRGMLGGGPASQHPRTQSQQIRRPVPHTVTSLSLRYPQLLCIFGAFSCLDALCAAKNRASLRSSRRLDRVNDAPTRRSAVHRSGLAAPHPGAHAPIFINSQPRRGLLRRGESPLSATAATYP